jgi:hypothetical protein
MVVTAFPEPSGRDWPLIRSTQGPLHTGAAPEA